jgi:hypothetical protein
VNVIAAVKMLQEKGGVIRQVGWPESTYIECRDPTYYLLWTDGVRGARATPTIADLLAQYEWSPAAPPTSVARKLPTPADYATRTAVKVASTRGELRALLHKDLRDEPPNKAPRTPR